MRLFAGTLTINGNPRLDNSGNISLSIRERDAPVSIAPGTKNLVLNVALDREGKTGPSSVYVNVICVRRHTTDPVSCMLFLCAIIMLQLKVQSDDDDGRKERKKKNLTEKRRRQNTMHAAKKY